MTVVLALGAILGRWAESDGMPARLPVSRSSDARATYVEVPITFDAVRTDADGTSLVVTFNGLRPTGDPHDSCVTAYRADVEVDHDPPLVTLWMVRRNLSGVEAALCREGDWADLHATIPLDRPWPADFVGDRVDQDLHRVFEGGDLLVPSGSEAEWPVVAETGSTERSRSDPSWSRSYWAVAEAGRPAAKVTVAQATEAKMLGVVPPDAEVVDMGDRRIDRRPLTVHRWKQSDGQSEVAVIHLSAELYEGLVSIEVEAPAPGWTVDQLVDVAESLQEIS